ncbi:hypothetical protein [Glycomyces buryatensis]|uniref:Uncharacterized protein n=1 Tax=Glycomyces buryatensis TaxID=2570927 RepID=A0A4S8QKN8_9ACTN|nr:hypothetical protein [Glycomyces buryatensis]THV43565.1 hypothetical protein FAB82_00460 [Glycomyces buryatensis]
MAKQQAASAGMSMSAWVARTIRTATFSEAARRAAEEGRAVQTGRGRWAAAKVAYEADEMFLRAGPWRVPTSFRLLG